jgi:hypothetical protein
METKLPRAVDSLLRETVTGNLLRYAAGQAIFCPGCAAILNWQDTVIFEGLVLCCDCFAERTSRVDIPAEDKRHRFETADLDCARNIHVADDGTVMCGAVVLTED